MNKEITKIVQTINQRMDNKETTTTKIVTAKATHKTVAIKQIQTIKTAIPKTITVLQRIKIGPAKITMAGTTKTVAAKTVTTILVAVKIVITGITLITKTAIVSIKREKGKHQQESAKPAVPARKFRELPDVLEYTEGMNVADIAKNPPRTSGNHQKLFMMGVMVNQNQALDKDTIELLAVDYGMEPQEKVQVDIADIDKFFEPEAVVEENLTTRPLLSQSWDT